MERIFGTFREASQEASRLCQQHGISASLERRGDSWAVTFDGSVRGGAAVPEPDPLLLEIQDLREQLAQSRSECRSLSARIETLSKVIDCYEREHLLVRPLLTQSITLRFASDVLEKMTQENALMLRRYGCLCELSESGQIDQVAFNEFTASSGIWVAIHNYEKIKSGPQPIHVPDHPRPFVELCSSCGGAVISGHCRCSD